MQSVSIIGIGQTPVTEHWSLSLRDLGVQAMRAALADASIQTVDAIIVGNALNSIFSHQNHLGALLADYTGLRGIEAVRVEGADASGGLAIHAGIQLIASGQAQTVAVLGLEKVTDMVGNERAAAVSTFLDTEYEAGVGATPVAIMAMLMRRYMREYNVGLDKFAGFTVNAHLNGNKNPYAMFRNLIKAESFVKAPAVAAPVSLFDIAPEADGAAVLILTNTERAVDMVPHPIRFLASAIATDRLSVHDREDLLFLSAVSLSAERAYMQAGITPREIDFVELHDSSTIMATLALESSGFAQKGNGWSFASDNKIGLTGELPLSTFGGLKARGNPFGATGVYQAVEAVLQLREQAGANQVPNAEIGMIQSVAGLGGTAVTHILSK